MSAIVIIAVFVKPRVRGLGIGGWGSLALFTLFAVNTWLLYRMDAGAH
jgi:hypothetical protein